MWNFIYKNIKVISLFLLFLPLLDGIVTSHSLLLEVSSGIEIENEYQFDESLLKFFQNMNKTHVIIPIGRYNPTIKEFSVFLNRKLIKPQIITDSFGGNWLNFTISILRPESKVKIILLKSKGPVPDYYYNLKNPDCISPTKFINSNDSNIIEFAKTIVLNANTHEEKAQIFCNFIHKEIHYDKTVKHENASDVLLYRSGVCRHKARLFIALCRAVNISSRAISGFIAMDTSPRNNLHQWAEFQNERGYWIQVDPTNNYFRITDPRIVDYFYGWNQNPYNSGILNFQNGSTLSFDNYLVGLKINAVKFSDISCRLSVKIYDLIGLFFCSMILNQIFLSKQKSHVFRQLSREYNPNWIQKKISRLKM